RRARPAARGRRDAAGSVRATARRVRRIRDRDRAWLRLPRTRHHHLQSAFERRAVSPFVGIESPAPVPKVGRAALNIRKVLGHAYSWPPARDRASRGVRRRVDGCRRAPKGLGGELLLAGAGAAL